MGCASAQVTTVTQSYHDVMLLLAKISPYPPPQLLLLILAPRQDKMGRGTVQRTYAPAEVVVQPDRDAGHDAAAGQHGLRQRLVAGKLLHAHIA